jgi:hypothetical protein
MDVRPGARPRNHCIPANDLPHEALRTWLRNVGGSSSRAPFFNRRTIMAIALGG